VFARYGGSYERNLSRDSLRCISLFWLDKFRKPERREPASASGLLRVLENFHPRWAVVVAVADDGLHSVDTVAMPVGPLFFGLWGSEALHEARDVPLPPLKVRAGSRALRVAVILAAAAHRCSVNWFSDLQTIMDANFSPTHLRSRVNRQEDRFRAPRHKNSQLEDYISKLS
jgi:hypothetical protein